MQPFDRAIRGVRGTGVRTHGLFHFAAGYRSCAWLTSRRPLSWLKNAAPAGAAISRRFSRRVVDVPAKPRSLFRKVPTPLTVCRRAGCRRF